MIVTTLNKEQYAFKRRILAQALTLADIDAMDELLLIKARIFSKSLLNKNLPRIGTMPRI